MMYKKRRDILQQVAAEQQLQYILIKDPANIFYYTGFLAEPHERFMAYIQNVQSGDMYFFVPALDKTAAKQASDIHTIIPIADTDDPLQVVEEACGHFSGNIGIEGRALSYALATTLQKSFPQTQLVDIQQKINKQRLCKSDNEIIALRKSIQLIEKVLEEGIKQIHIGMTETEAVAQLEFLMRKFGADGPSFDTIVLSGKKAALPHGVPSDQVIHAGDLLLIDCGVIKDGYCSDITRTFAIGEIDEQTETIYQIVKQANEAGIQAVRANVPLKSIDQAARNVIEDEGYGAHFTTRVGHGLGIEVHEEPSIHGNNEQLATPGMVFTIEPGIYIPDDIGIRIEDIVYINEDGEIEVLTSFTKELQTIGQ